MKYWKNIWSGILIVLFTGFVVSMVFGTTRNEIAETVQQAGDLASTSYSLTF